MQCPDPVQEKLIGNQSRAAAFKRNTLLVHYSKSRTLLKVIERTQGLNH